MKSTDLFSLSPLEYFGALQISRVWVSRVFRAKTSCLAPRITAQTPSLPKQTRRWESVYPFVQSMSPREASLERTKRTKRAAKHFHVEAFSPQARILCLIGVVLKHRASARAMGSYQNALSVWPCVLLYLRKYIRYSPHEYSKTQAFGNVFSISKGNHTNSLAICHRYEWTAAVAWIEGRICLNVDDILVSSDSTYNAF